MNKILVTVISIASVFYFISCENYRKPAEGPEDEIYVVADSSEYAYLSPVLDSTFEKIIYTPQPEKLFTINWISLNQLSTYKDKKNILVIAPLDSYSFTSRFIRSAFDTTKLEKIKNRQDFLLKKENLWAADQLVMFLTAPTGQELREDILKDKDGLLYAFQKVSDERLKSCLYNKAYENEPLEGKLLQKYGWVIYIQHDVKLELDAPKDNFVWLKWLPGKDMDRWLFVHWIDNASPAYLNEDSIRAIRNRVTEKYYWNKDDSSYIRIASDYYMSNEINFNGRYAIFTQGLWEFNKKGMGGPFINYTFFDAKTNRLYMLDGSIFAPKYYKRNLIQQTDVLLQSFMTEPEVAKDKKLDLLAAAKKSEQR
jgi:hypothetical protein